MSSSIGNLSLLVLCCSLSLAVGLISRPTADLSLMRFMSETRDVQSTDPNNTIACFDKFVPVMSQNLDTYEKDYKACLVTADANRLSIDKTFQPQLDWIEDTAVDVCTALYECSSINATRGALQCYNGAGSNHSMALYSIAANASETDAAIAQKYELIDFDQNRCTNASEERYVQRTADTYSAMHLCFLGRQIVLEPNTSTTAVTDDISTESSSTVNQPAVSEASEASEAAAEAELAAEAEASEAQASDAIARSASGAYEDHNKKPSAFLGKNILSFINNIKQQLRH